MKFLVVYIDGDYECTIYCNSRREANKLARAYKGKVIEKP